MKFDFETDSDAQQFCARIAQEMVRLFGISVDEAVGRINEAWRGLSIAGDDIVFHETEGYWANNIYYGKNSNWWLSPPNLKPRPYPRSRG